MTGSCDSNADYSGTLGHLTVYGPVPNNQD